MNDHESIIIMDYYVILIILLKFILIRDGTNNHYTGIIVTPLMYL